MERSGHASGMRPSPPRRPGGFATLRGHRAADRTRRCPGACAVWCGPPTRREGSRATRGRCATDSCRPCGRSPRRTPVREPAAWRGPPCGQRRCVTAWWSARPRGVRWSLASSISREPVARPEPEGRAGVGPWKRCACVGSRASRGGAPATGSGGRADPPPGRPRPARRRRPPAAVTFPRPRRTRPGRGRTENGSTPTVGAPRSAGAAPTGSPRPGSGRRVVKGP